MRPLLLRVFVAAWLLGSAGLAAQDFVPARLKSGDAPAPPPNFVGWGWIVSGQTVSAEGRLVSAGGGWGMPGLEGSFWTNVSSTWLFEPARDGNERVEGRVLVAACYRPATLSTGPESAAPDVQSLKMDLRDVPLPTTMVPPSYPPRALGDGVAIVELVIDVSGTVKDARIARSAGAFDSAALDAARQWRFRPATRAGVAVPAYAYVVFGFRQPVT